MNRFDKSLERIKKNAEPQDSWTDEDFEHLKTIISALETCSKIEEKNIDFCSIIS